MRIIGWRAWYIDGEIFESSSTQWADIPDDGALAFVLYFDERAPSNLPLRRIMSGTDWYFKSGDVYGQNSDVEKEVKRRYPGAILKRGKWTTDEEMQIIIDATAVSRFAPK